METVDEPEAMSDTLLPNLEGLLGRQRDRNSAINATCREERTHAEWESITSP